VKPLGENRTHKDLISTRPHQCTIEFSFYSKVEFFELFMQKIVAGQYLQEG
jgi:hypothetical protein